jgi:hypothetical protein
MDFKIYFSLYIVIWALLYYINIINLNPIYWLYIATIVSSYILIYLVYYNSPTINILYFIFLNSPKILFILLINNNNPIQGFIFGLILFIIYLFIINFNLYNIYYTNTIIPLLNFNLL